MTYDPSSIPIAGSPAEYLNWSEAAAYCNALSDAEGLGRCYDCEGAGPRVTCGSAAAYATPYDCPGYRLPTEAEWEYAARAGTTTATYNGDLDVVSGGCSSPSAVLDPIAWWCSNSGGWPQVVGTKTANGWGLYDMLGNVLEWCDDSGEIYAGAVTDPWGSVDAWGQMFRGGSFGSYAYEVRAAKRAGTTGPEIRDAHLGLRPIRTLDP
jgi:formylglycine-generating enzyme